MKTFTLNRVSLAAALAATLVVFAADDAQAWSRGRWGSFGGFGSFGGHASYGGYGSYGAYAGYSSAGSYGSWGSYARYHDDDCYVAVSHGSYGSSGGTYYDDGMYTAPDATGPDPTPPIPAPPTADGPPPPPQASIRLSVPPDARVFVDDRLTASTGAERMYIARGLQRGAAYAYRMRVEFAVDGKHVVENRRVDLEAGDAINLTFGDGQQLAEQDAATTKLTLEVPENAKVTLAGAETAKSGHVRTFATRALAAGQTWDDYVVRVEVERDGQTLVEEQALDIVGGQSYDLAFDFEDEPIKIVALD